MVQVKQIVEEIINDNKVAVFSKSYCSYSVKAKKLLKDRKVEFICIELDQDDNGTLIQQYLVQKTGQRTVPNIFINQQHVGGCDNLLKAKNSGKLKELLK